MWEPQPLTTLRASTACTGITLPNIKVDRKETAGEGGLISCGWRSGPVAGPYEHDNELFGPIRGGEFVDQLTEH
jgi:hypothetical protein